AFFGVIFKSVEIGLLIAVMKIARPFLLSFSIIDVSDVSANSIESSRPDIKTSCGGNIFCQNPSTSDKAKDCSTWEASRYNGL
ncbi:hypothetical protein A2U01_0060540, partial [Trifolium medium]|nr:hypothetical protein [Trifolium medium]